MSWLKRITIIFSFLVSTNAFADDNAKIKELVQKYKDGINQQKIELVKETTSESFYSKLNRNELLKRLFKKNKPKQSPNYSINVVNSKIIKDYIVANIQEKESEHKESYKIIKTDSGFKIDSIIHLDE